VDQFLTDKLALLSKNCPLILRQAMQYSLLAPGKRLRPVLALLTCETIIGHHHPAMAFGAALEMIHCYSLIHDDLPAMDDDDLRRGRPTCHIQFDEATAILAGDALQAYAFQVILESDLEPAQKVAAGQILAAAAGAEGMVGGQVDDIQAETHGGDADFLMAIHRRKTGAMIRASALMGVEAAGGSESDRKAFEKYGECIGIAFQIADDLLDVEGSCENTGKRTGKDQDRGKLTYPSFWGVEESRRKAERYVEEAFDSLQGYGEAALPLRQLARYIIERNQ
jgi:geranylgeranyl diphosphate synthase type II